jgi:hypothetical protein
MKNSFDSLEKTKSDHSILLSDLAASSEQLKLQCTEIDDELDSHHTLLSEISLQTESNSHTLSVSLSKLDKLLEKYSTSSLMYLLIFLLFLLILLILV